MSLKREEGKMQTPLARARGLGSSRSAVGGWIRLRVWSVGLALLAPWFVWFVKSAAGLSHEEFIGLLARPLNAICMILFIIAAFAHATLGCREIIEDYFHLEWMKISKLVALYLFFFATGLGCVFSVLKVALG